MAQSPGAFSVVMATGIVSVASRRQFADISITLLWVGIAAFVTMAVRETRREVRWQGRRPRPTRDKWFDALTFVAAAAVMADRLGRADHTTAQLILSVAAVAAWVIPALAIARTSIAAPSLVSANTSGSWLLSVVATQSVSFIAAIRAASDHDRALAVIAALLSDAWLRVVSAPGGFARTHRVDPCPDRVVSTRSVDHDGRPRDHHPGRQRDLNGPEHTSATASFGWAT
jgi:small-conductance mechanosensitive channel